MTPHDDGAATQFNAKKLARKRYWLTFKTTCVNFSRHKGGMFALCVLAIVSGLALIAPLISDISVIDPSRATAESYQPPSREFLLGTDMLGRDVVELLLWGAQTSLLVGAAATLMSTVIGTAMGLLAGTTRGWRSGLIMRIIDFFLIIPGLVLAIVLSAVLGPSTLTIVIAIGVTSWAGTARVIRSQALSLVSRGYVERARALGASQSHIVWKHILPGVAPLVLANTSLSVGVAIIAEATLAFLGISGGGISWGTMLQLAMGSGAAVAGYWWLVVAPGLAILIVVLAFTVVSRTLESVINPSGER